MRVSEISGDFTDSHLQFLTNVLAKASDLNINFKVTSEQMSQIIEKALQEVVEEERNAYKKFEEFGNINPWEY